MIAENLSVYRFSLPLAESCVLQNNTLKTRDGLLLKISDEEGNAGFGEITPLYGFSRETLKEAEQQILHLRNSFEGEDIPASIAHLNGTMSQWLKDFKLLPSVQCGLEAACLTLMAKKKGRTLAGLLGDQSEHSINVNGLLLCGDETNILNQAKKLFQEGFRTLKVKIGRFSVKQAAEIVTKIYEETHAQVLMRLDINQSWSFAQTLEFAQTVGLLTIEYIEEPFKDIKKIPEFYEKTMIPVALDESLLNQSLDDIRHIEGVDVLVLKPALLGGLEKTWQIAQFAHVIGLKAVITSSFETSLGLYTLAQMAANLPHYVSHGLDTVKFFKKDILKKPVTIHQGQIDINQFSFDSAEIDFDILEQLV